MTKTQRAMLLSALNRGGTYRPKTRGGFVDMQVMIAAGMFTECDACPGAYSLTAAGEQEADKLSETCA